MPSSTKKSLKAETSLKPAYIADAIEDLFRKQDFEFEGCFHFSEAYHNAPDPMLSTDACDSLNFPLACQQLEEILEESDEVQHDMDGQAGPSRAWALEASQLSFENPEWAEFLTQVTGDFCTNLGLESLGHPSHHLRELVINVSDEESDAIWPPTISDTSVPNTFATLVIILPSSFVGGTFEVKEGESMTLVYSDHQNAATLVLGCLHGVEVSSSPIISGSRACLVYDLSYPDNIPRPTLASVHSGLGELKNTFSAWSNLGFNAPQKIVCVLDTTYDELEMAKLKGQDRRFAEALVLLTAECGFRVGLGSFWVEISGRGYDEGDGDENPSNFHMEEPSEEGTLCKIEELCDMDGDFLADDVELDRKREIIPKDVMYGISDDDPYEGELGELEDDDYSEDEFKPWRNLDRPPVCGDLTLRYRRSAIVIWPAIREDEVLGGPKYVENASKKLMDHPDLPKDEQQKLADHLLLLVTSGQEKNAPTITSILRAVSEVAGRIGDTALWDRAVTSCNGLASISQLGNSGIVASLRRIQHAIVLPRIETIIKNETSVPATLALFKQMDGRSGLDECKDWIATQEKRLLSSITGISAEELDPLLSLAYKNGGLQSVQDTVVKLVKNSHDSSLTLALASMIHNQRTNSGELFSGDQDAALAKSLVTDLLVTSIETTDFYKEPASEKTGNSGRYLPPQPNASLAIHHLITCLETHNTDRIPHLIQKVTDFEGLSAEVSASRCKHVVLPLASKILVETKATNSFNPSVAAFELVRTASLHILSVDYRSKISAADFITLISLAGGVVGDVDIISDTIMPKLLELRLNLRVVQPLVQDLLHRKSLIDATFLNTLVRDTIQRHMAVRPPQTIDLLEFCFVTKRMELCEEVLATLTKDLNARDLEGSVVRLIPGITDFLAKHRLSPCRDPFAAFYKGVMLGWVKLVLGPAPPKPAELTKRIADTNARILAQCTCKSCQHLANSLNEDKSTSNIIDFLWIRNKTGKDAKHIRDSLERSGAGYFVEEPPQCSGFQLERTGLTKKHSQWELKAQEGARVLRGIHKDIRVLEAIFGSQDFRTLLQLLGMAEDTQASFRKRKTSLGEQASPKRRKFVG